MLYVVVNTLDCSVPFSGSRDECRAYVDEHPADKLAGTLIVETETDYDRIMCGEGEM